MSVATDTVAVITPVCPRVFPLEAPFDTERPYVIYQTLPGRALRWLDKSASDKRHRLVQVTAWADTLLEAEALIAQIEEAFCASAVVSATPMGDAGDVAGSGPDIGRYGQRQDFSAYFNR
jgi:hypothetical protein